MDSVALPELAARSAAAIAVPDVTRIEFVPPKIVFGQSIPTENFCPEEVNVIPMQDP